jgi:hypothetical protein
LEFCGLVVDRTCAAALTVVVPARLINGRVLKTVAILATGFGDVLLRRRDAVVWLVNVAVVMILYILSYRQPVMLFAAFKLRSIFQTFKVFTAAVVAGPLCIIEAAGTTVSVIIAAGGYGRRHGEWKGDGSLEPDLLRLSSPK